MTAMRRKSEFLDDREKKKPRKEGGCGFVKVCVKLIDELINYPAGWIFSEPVDPVKLKIPDYFSIIKKPMDLGTVKRNLEGGLYFDVEEFAADVRLVFSNAMLYNPPLNEVHVLAKKLDSKFDRRWKFIEARLKSGDREARLKSGDRDDGQKNPLIKGIAATGLKKGFGEIGNCRATSFETKQKFRAELERLLSKQVVGDVQTLFRKLGLTDFTEEKLHSYLRSCDDESLQKLRREVGAFLSAKHEKVKSAHVAQKGCPALKKTIQRENHGQSACELDNQGQSVDPKLVKSAHKAQEGFPALKKTIQRENCSHCPCKLDNQGQSVDCKFNFEMIPPLVRHLSSSHSESDRPKVVHNPEYFPHPSTPATDAVSFEGYTLSYMQMSQSHALRAAMLKKRFADTIFKAMHQESEKKDQNSNSLSKQKERERLVKEQQQEKARIEAEIRAAEAASRRLLEDSKTKFERQRAAARMALEKMEGTVVIDVNAGLLEDLMRLGDGSLTYLYYGVKGSQSSCLLERVGLHLKGECSNEEEQDFEEGETLL